MLRDSPVGRIPRYGFHFMPGLKHGGEGESARPALQRAGRKILFQRFPERVLARFFGILDTALWQPLHIPCAVEVGEPLPALLAFVTIGIIPRDARTAIYDRPVVRPVFLWPCEAAGEL